MNKLFLTGIVSTIGAAGLALSGCGAGVPESKEALIEEGLKKIAESSSISGTARIQILILPLQVKI